jgi:hypothetical protein
MRLYIRTDGSYAGTQADAGKGWKLEEVPTDKPGLLAYLNAMVGHRKAVAQECLTSFYSGMDVAEASQRPVEAPPAAIRPGYAEKSARFEDEFSAMPLALQLHFAALAMENARDAL